MMDMTKRQRLARLTMIRRCAAADLPDDPTVASDDDVLDMVKSRLASDVGRWVAYHRGLGSPHADKDLMPRSRR
jgi:hypothetical protein